jgi:hypothetical protein
MQVLEAVISHLIRQVGHGLKLATTISKAHIVVSGPLTKLGATCKVTIHGTSEEGKLETHTTPYSPSTTVKKSLTFIAMDIDRVQSIEIGLCDQVEAN